MNNERSYLITFIDLLYAAIISYGLSVLHKSLENQTISSAFVIFAIVLAMHDWYGEHWVAITKKIGAISTIFDFIALMIYFGLIFFGSSSSLYFLALLAFRALRGIILNIILLTKHLISIEATRVRAWNISSIAMFIAYAITFSIGFWDSSFSFSEIEVLLVSISIWISSYIIFYVAEFIGNNTKRLDKYIQNISSIVGRFPARIEKILRQFRHTNTLLINKAHNISSKEKIHNNKGTLKESVKFYDAVAEIFERDFYSREADPSLAFDVTRIWQLISKKVKASDKVLEIGCGTGYWLDKISSDIGADTYGIDISQRMITIARSKVCSSFVVAEAAHLPFGSKVFDVVISPFNALNHCPDYKAAFIEIRRVLKDSGLALLLLDNKNRIVPLYWHLTAPNIRTIKNDPRSGDLWKHIVNEEQLRVFTHFYTREEVISLLSDFQITIYGIGLLNLLIPFYLRRNARLLSWALLKLFKPIEIYLSRRIPSKAAHLFVEAKKKDIHNDLHQEI